MSHCSRGGFVDKPTLRRKTEELIVAVRGYVFLATWSLILQVGPLPPDEKQIIEILKAISVDPRVLILDEATASLDYRQVQRLFELVAQWKQQGKAIVLYLTRMEEIFQLADRYSVLRNGRRSGKVLMAGYNATMIWWP